MSWFYISSMWKTVYAYWKDNWLLKKSQVSSPIYLTSSFRFQYEQNIGLTYKSHH